MKRQKRFQLSLLHPRYWLTWFGLALLFLLVQLPYPLLNRLGVWMGRTSMRFLKRRVTITVATSSCASPRWTKRSASVRW